MSDIKIYIYLKIIFRLEIYIYISTLEIEMYLYRILALIDIYL